MTETEESQKPSVSGHFSSGYFCRHISGEQRIHKPVSQSTSQNLKASLSSGTIGGMKVLAVKGIAKQGNSWAVR